MSNQVGDANISSSEQTANVTVHAYSDLSDLSIDSLIITEGATIFPNPDSVSDFTSDVEFTITTYQDYDWKVIVEKEMPEVEITKFEVEGERSTIIDHGNQLITVIMPVEYDLCNLNITSFEYTPEEHTLSPDYTIVHELCDTVSFFFSEMLEWKVIAQHEASMFTSFTIEDQISSTINFDQNTIDVLMPSTADLSNLRITSFHYLPENSTVTPGDEVTDFSSPVTYEFEDGTLWVVNVTQEAFEGEQVPFSNFTTWFLNGSSQNRGYYLPGNDISTPWRSGDKGAAEVIFPAFLHTVFPYPNTISPSGGTLETKSVLGKLASGSLFTGEIHGSGIDNVDTDFGVPFTSRPKRFKTTFTYEPQSYSGTMDECDIYVILQVREGSGDQEKRYRLATAWYRSDEEVKSFKELSMDLTYGELSGVPTFMLPSEESKEMPEHGFYHDDEANPTHIIVVFASSAHGASFIGGVGSKMVTQGIELEY
ncbi:PCMD domain-containing protein [Flammeovirga sp. OC4]|uniref:PCMD domain-containing protein n=1 Tax=Flammeovirga sp. OC4 TaxID=1382345 RepID=UPI00155DCDD5|nr:PCMD domain-containing protein [Flammeovirga sp. OC4]